MVVDFYNVVRNIAEMWLEIGTTVVAVDTNVGLVSSAVTRFVLASLITPIIVENVARNAHRGLNASMELVGMLDFYVSDGGLMSFCSVQLNDDD